MLIIDGYNFQFKNFNKGQTIIFWRCTKRSCRMLLHTILENEFLRYHLPNPVKIEVRNLREVMRKGAEK
jgi:hypothetical protein